MTEEQIHFYARAALKGDGGTLVSPVTTFFAGELIVELTTFLNIDVRQSLWWCAYLPSGETLDNIYGQLLIADPQSATPAEIQQAVLDLKLKLEARWLSETLS